MRNERVLAAGLEGRLQPDSCARVARGARARQRRDARRADRVLALSAAFRLELVV